MASHRLLLNTTDDARLVALDSALRYYCHQQPLLYKVADLM